ncbi:hypothetical protein [Streptomyces sp. NPDC046862]|uniref:Cgl0159 family (beta/alpha)8-fold protein n=1 Tax=Streptomyces sp. NPDC046862 TaxID=3154603 RepID=UPI003452304A
MRNDLSAEAVTKSLAIASGLGGTSACTWLKVPVTENPDYPAGGDVATAVATAVGLL